MLLSVQLMYILKGQAVIGAHSVFYIFKLFQLKTNDQVLTLTFLMT